MQDANSGLFGKYFKKQTKPQDLLSNKEHPLFLRIDTDPQMRKKVESGINAKIASEINTITIDQNYFTLITQELDRLRPLDRTLVESNTKILSLETQIEELSRKYEEQASTFARLEREQEHEKQLLRNEITELKEIVADKDKELTSLRRRFQEQGEHLNSLYNEKMILDGRLASKGNEVAILKSKLHDLHFEYKKYQKILYPNMKDTEEQEENESSEGEAINKEIEIKKVIDLTYMFSDVMGEKICEYLEYRDVLSLRQVSKFLKLAIDNNTKYYLLLAKQIKTKWRRTQADILRKLNFHKDQAAMIPSNYIKHCFIKFIRLKETVGEYMPKIIEQCQNFFKLLNEMEPSRGSEAAKYEAYAEPKKSFLSSFLKGPSKPNSEISPSPLLGSRTPLSSQTSLPIDIGRGPSLAEEIMAGESQGKTPTHGSPEKESFSSEASLAMSVSTRSRTEQRRDPDMPEDLVDSQEMKRLLFNKELANNPWCIFIPVDAVQNFTKDKEQMLMRARGYVEKLLTEMDKKKGVIASNKELLLQFLQCFVKLFIYARILLQESKELEGLKDYVVSKYEEVKEKIVRYENFVEDHSQALDTEKQLRNFFEKRASELEAEVHKNNAKILKDSESIMTLQNQMKTTVQELENLKKDKQETDAKLKKLVKEVKNLRGKNKELDDNSNRIMNGYLDIKIAFDNLNIDL